MAVSAYIVEQSALSREISATGEIKANKNYKVISRIPSYVASVNKKEGDSVKKGNLLILLETENFKNDYKNALLELENIKQNVEKEILALRYDYQQAKYDHEDKVREFKRIEALKEINSVSNVEYIKAKQNLDSAINNLEIVLKKLNMREGTEINAARTAEPLPIPLIVKASIEMKSAENRLVSTKQRLDSCTISAPIGGVIKNIHVEVGDKTADGALLVEIFDNSNLIAEVDIDEIDIGYVELGQVVKIESDTFKDNVFEGEVAYIAPVIKTKKNKRICEVKIKLKNYNNLVKVGASCTVFITIFKENSTPVIPISSYRMEDEKNYVYYLQNSGNDFYSIIKREIIIGLVEFNRVEIKTGLKVGDLIARENLKYLKNGQKVKISKNK